MFWSLFFSFFSAVISGVLIQIWFSSFDEKFLQPRRNFQITRQKITSTLMMYAGEYTDPHDVPLNMPLNAPYHKEAQQKLRTLSAELEGVIESFYVPDESRNGSANIFERVRIFTSKHIYKNLPGFSDMQEMQRSIMGLSNSLFLPAGGNQDKHGQAERNKEESKIIQNLLYSRRGK